MTLDLDRITLDRGSHSSYEDGVCVMELAAWLANEPITDAPACVSPVLGEFLRSWNDGLTDDARQMLKPYAARVLNTADNQDVARAWLATDWLARTCAPAFLRLSPALVSHADAVAQLAPLEGVAAAAAARPVLAAARDAARAALEPTVTELQTSALALLDRMIDPRSSTGT